MKPSPLARMKPSRDAGAMDRMIAAADRAQNPRHTATEAVVRFETLPTSVNDLYVEIRKRVWIGGKWVLKVRRIKTKEYAEWHDAAVDQIKLVQRPPLVRGDVHVDWLMATNRRRDLDGTLKAGFDALQAAGVIENDRKTTGLTCYWDDDVAGAVATVRSV